MQISAFLQSRGITVTPIGPAKVGNGAMTMPMVGGTVTLTANVNGHRIAIATMSSPSVHMTQTKGTMSGGLHISAVWAKTLNQLVGLNVVHSGETIGQLSMTIKMG
jgi:hypothetical protein